MSRPATNRTGRQRKLECPRCGFICYASAGAVQRAGLPTCGCGGRLEVANPRDLAVIDPEAFEDLANGMQTRGSYNALMRSCGYTDMVIRDKSSDQMARAKAVASRRATMTRRAVWAAQDAGMPF